VGSCDLKQRDAVEYLAPVGSPGGFQAPAPPYWAGTWIAHSKGNHGSSALPKPKG